MFGFGNKQLKEDIKLLEEEVERLHEILKDEGDKNKEISGLKGQLQTVLEANKDLMLRMADGEKTFGKDSKFMIQQVHLENEELREELESLRLEKTNSVIGLSKEELEKVEKMLEKIPIGASGYGLVKILENGKVRTVEVENRKEIEDLIKEAKEEKIKIISL